MILEIEQNFKEKLRLILSNLLESLDGKIKKMLAEHSRDGLLRSGDTIKRTMDFISSENATFYQEIINHMGTINLQHYPLIESDVQKLAKSVHASFKQECLSRLKKSTEIARNPKLYERMIPKVEESMASDLANFQNDLNALVIDLKQQKFISSFEKAVWGFEGLLLLFSMFIAGMWYKNPEGNYEPVLVGLALIIPLIAVWMKFGRK